MFAAAAGAGRSHGCGGGRIVLIQHEWGGLHWLRRITYIPALLLADTIVMFSPLVRRELAEDPLVGWTAKKCVLAPLPPNIEAPAGTADSKLRQRLAAARAERTAGDRPFRIDLSGQAAQRAARHRAILKARGLKPLMVYIGSFIRGVDKVEQEFYARATELGIADDVIVSGYRRIRPRGVRPVQRDRRVLLSARRGPHRAALQRSDLRPVRQAADRHRPRPSRTNSIIIRGSRN